MKKKLLIVLLLCIMLLTITGCGNKENQSENTSEEKVTQSERKQNIIKLFRNALVIRGFLDNENVETFTVSRIYYDGYYKSKPDNEYLNLYFNVTCKKGSNCLRNVSHPVDNSNYYVLWINTDEKKVYDVMSGMSISQGDIESGEYKRVSQIIN